MKKKLILLTTVLMFSQLIRADVISTDQSQEVENTKKEVLPDSMPSSPPLVTDDPGTPGHLGFEINLTENVEAYSNVQINALGIEANLGLGESWQLRIQKDQVQEKGPDQGSYYGYGPTSVGVKWRFLDNNSFKMAFYPSFDFDDKIKREGESYEGRKLYIPLIIAKTWGRSTVVINVGANSNLDFSDKRSTFVSLAAGNALSDTLRLVGEVTSEKSDDWQKLEARFGGVKELFADLKHHYNTALFASVGHNIGWTPDNLDHTKVLVGLAIAKNPRTEGM